MILALLKISGNYACNYAVSLNYAPRIKIMLHLYLGFKTSKHSTKRIKTN